MIEAGDVAAFIDNVMVETEIEEGHDDIVENVLRRMEKNDLFVKLENTYGRLERLDFWEL